MLINIGNVKKLLPNLFDKEKYVIHYENLKLSLRLGLKLRKYIGYKNSITIVKTMYSIQHKKE